MFFCEKSKDFQISVLRLLHLMFNFALGFVQIDLGMSSCLQMVPPAGCEKKNTLFKRFLTICS